MLKEECYQRLEKALISRGFVLKRSVFNPSLELYPWKKWDIMMHEINKLESVC
jgi:DNA-binding transcriptional regulator/RsmH inhibitor MraZ